MMQSSIVLNKRIAEHCTAKHSRAEQSNLTR